MKRILQVVSTLEQGGMEAVVLNYFNNMDKDKIIFDFLVVWGAKEGYHEAALLQKGCKIFRMKNPPKKIFAHGKELKEFFAREKYDVVQIHAMSPFRYVIAKAAKKSGVKTVIYHAHTAYSGKHKFLQNYAKNKINKWCDYKFACSALAGNYMYNGEFKVVNNAIDTAYFAYNEDYRKELRNKYAMENKFIIGHVGRLVALKNHMFLLKILPYILQENKNAVFLFVGDGEEKTNLMNYATENGLNENIIFAGAVGAEVYKYYSIFDVLAFPSLYEGLSMVLMESQANGLPIVASDKITEENRVTDNFRFLPIDENTANYKVWAKAICDFNNARSDNAVKVANAGFDIKTEAKKLQDFYLNL